MINRLRIWPWLITLVIFFSSPASAEPYAWQRIEIPNFTIYFTAQSSRYADRLATIAPTVHDKVARFFDVTPDHCNIVIWPNQDEFNGGFSSFPNRIDLYDTLQVDYAYFGVRQPDIVELVLAHEYTHFVHMGMVLPKYKLLIPIYGSAFLSFNNLSPYWFVEGLAVFMETYNSPAGRGNSTKFHDAWIQNSLTHPYDYWQASVHLPAQVPAERGYEFGYHLVDFIYRHYGKDAVVRLAKEFDPFATWFRFTETLQMVTGKPFSQLVVDFEYERMQQPGAEQSTSRSIYSSNGNPIRGYFWQNGSIWVARGTEVNAGEWAKIDPQSGKTIERIPLKIMQNDTDLAVIGSRIWLTARHSDTSGREIYSDLFSVNLRQNEWRPETDRRHFFDFAVNSRATQIAAVQNIGFTSKIVLINPLDHSETELVSTEDVTFYSPQFIASDQKLLITAHQNQCLKPIELDIQTKTIRDIASDIPTTMRESVLSPSGQWMLFLSDVSHHWNVYALNVQSRVIFQLTRSVFGTDRPNWNEDGTMISFIEHHPDGDHLAVLPFSPTQTITFKPAEPLPQTDSKPVQDGEFEHLPSFPLNAYAPYHLGYIPSILPFRANNLGPAIGFLGATPTVETRYFAGVSLSSYLNAVYPVLSAGASTTSFGPEIGTFASQTGQPGTSTYSQQTLGLYTLFSIVHRRFPTTQLSRITGELDFETSRYQTRSSIDNVVSISDTFIDLYPAPKSDAMTGYGSIIQTRISAGVNRQPLAVQTSVTYKQFSPAARPTDGWLLMIGGSYSADPIFLGHPTALARYSFSQLPNWIVSGGASYWQPIGIQDQPAIPNWPIYVWKSKWGVFTSVGINFAGSAIGAAYAADWLLFGLPILSQFDVGYNPNEGSFFIFQADQTLFY